MSFYTSVTGIKAAQTDIGTISHNLANVETNGFKRSRTDFIDLVASSRLTSPNAVTGVGTAVQGKTQIFAQGAIEQTGSALDLAVAGEGFFTVRQPGAANETAYTRNGSFALDANGFIVSPGGARLQGVPVDAAGQPTATAPAGLADLVLPPVNAAGAEAVGISVNEAGVVAATYGDGSIDNIGRVSLASFMSPTGLVQRGGNIWTATGQSGAPDYGVANAGMFGSVMSGAIERSNVDITEELVGLISAQRNFQANAKAVDTSAQLTQSILQIRN